MTHRPPRAVREWTTFTWRALAGDDVPAPAHDPPVGELQRLKLGAAAHRALSMRGLPSPRPLATDYRSALAHNVLRVERIDRMAAWLDDAGVRWVLHKGSALVTRHPDWLGVRPMLDIDVLVAPEDYDRAAAAIIEHGAREAELGMPVASRWACERALHLPDDGGPIEIDLHRAVHHWPLFVEVGAGMLARRERVAERWIPAPVDAVLAIAVHRLKGGLRGDGRELLDARWYLAELDPAELAAAAQAAHLVPAVAWLLSLVRLWFGDAPGDEARAAALDDSMSPVRRYVTDQLICRDASLRGRPGRRPRFVDMYTYVPLLSNSGGRAAATASIHAALRAADLVVLAAGRR